MGKKQPSKFGVPDHNYNPFEDTLIPLNGNIHTEVKIPMRNSTRDVETRIRESISGEGTSKTISPTPEQINAAIRRAQDIQRIKAEGVVTSQNGVNRSDDSEKTNYTLIDYDMLERWAVHMTKNVKGRGKNNWRKAGSADADRFREGAWRHFMAWLLGENDEDHAAALFFNVAGYEFAISQWEESA